MMGGFHFGSVDPEKRIGNVLRGLVPLKKIRILVPSAGRIPTKYSRTVGATQRCPWNLVAVDLAARLRVACSVALKSECRRFVFPIPREVDSGSHGLHFSILRCYFFRLPTPGVFVRLHSSLLTATFTVTHFLPTSVCISIHGDFGSTAFSSCRRGAPRPLRQGNRFSRLRVSSA